MFVIYEHIKSHMPSSSGSLVIAIKPKAKCGYSAAAILVFLQIIDCLNKRCIFSRIYYHTKFKDHASGTNVYPTSEISKFEMLVLLVARVQSAVIFSVNPSIGSDTPTPGHI
jgi:hypothetical protein